MTQKKKSNRTLYWIIGTEFLGICFFITVYAVALRTNFLTSETLQITSTTLTLPTGTLEIIAPTPTFLPATDEVTIITPASSTLTPATNLLLSIGDLNTILPEDVLTEITFFGGGLGGFSCPQTDGPSLSNSPEETEWLHSVSVTICGWAVNESVKVDIYNPEGVLEKSEAFVATSTPLDTIGETGMLVIEYQPSLVSKIGTYRFVFEGGNDSVETNVKVIMPSGVKLYRVSNPESIVLYGFFPNEKVRLLVYEINPLDGVSPDITAHMIGWKEFSVNEDGQLVIPITPEEPLFYFAAVGESSGIASEVRNGLMLMSDIYLY